MESILSELARGGSVPNVATANKLSQNAIGLMAKGAGGNSIDKADAGASTLVLSLFVEAARLRITADDFTSTASDYFPEPVTQALVTNYVSAAKPLTKMLSTFFADLPHCVGVSSTVQHHVRDFAVKQQDAEQEKPRSVANFVFALDLAARGTVVSNSGGGDDNAAQVDGDVSQVAFQCTGEQALEFANSLRAAAAALQRAEARVMQQ